MHNLEKLAALRFKELSAAELLLLSSLPEGREAHCSVDGNPQSDARNGLSWGPERQIRSAIIRWLSVDLDARKFIDPNGIQVYGARFVGPLNLYSADVSFQLRFHYCRFDSEINLQSAKISGLHMAGTWIRSLKADGVRVTNHIFLRGGFRADGPVRLLGAHVGGGVDCENATFNNPQRAGVPDSGISIAADGIVVGGTFFLRRGFVSIGEVRMPGAQIGAYLDFSGGVFANRSSDDSTVAGSSINIEGAKIAGPILFLRGFRSEGDVSLLGAEIGGDLNFSGAAIISSDSGIALGADRTTINGTVLLGEGFRARGEVRFLGAEIAGDLQCSGGHFKNPRRVEDASYSLSAHSAVIKRNVLLREGFTAAGEVAFVGAQIGGNLECSDAAFEGELNLQTSDVKGDVFMVRRLSTPQGFRLNFTNARAGAIRDDMTSWPAPGNLILDGFVYRRFADPSPVDVGLRLDWVARQKQYAPQPFRQLASVLRDEGDSVGAQRVLFEMERSRLPQGSLPRRAWRFIIRLVIGYGYYPQWSLYWLLSLVLLGAAIFAAAFYSGAIIPVDPEAYRTFSECHRLPPYYAAFHASIYSLENSFPLVKLGQIDRWQPAPGYVSLEWLRWAQTILGWFFATMGVAGLAGLIRKD